MDIQLCIILKANCESSVIKFLYEPAAYKPVANLQRINWEAMASSKLMTDSQTTEKYYYDHLFNVNVDVRTLTKRSHGEQIAAAPATGVFSPSSPRYFT